jgi:hypothetical protein
MNLYVSSLAILVLANVGLAYFSRRGRHLKGDRGSAVLSNFRVEILRLFGSSSGRTANFKYTFFVVYALVVASDWLQVREAAPC